MQGYGEEFAARVIQYAADEERASITLDIRGAYPIESLVRWERALTLNRGHSIQLVESFETDGSIHEITLSMITACEVQVCEGEVNLLSANLDDSRSTGAGRIVFDQTRVSVETERIELADNRLRSAWGERLFRILFKTTNPPAKDTWTFTILPS